VGNDRVAIVARARSLIGARFRPQGRKPEQGLDCLGVVMIAADVARDRVPDDYRLDGGDPDELHGGLDACGFARLGVEEAGSGDVLLVSSAPTQIHAVVLTADGFVHAHAGLRRVVETPGAVPWPVISAWRRDASGD
jgi:murein DD-endopeptidase / murein LD-carboxypeptidase